MATVRSEFDIQAPIESVWSAVCDSSRLTELFHGILTDVQAGADERIVTFADGNRVREVIITVDDTAKRFVYSARGGRTTHHNAVYELQATSGATTHVTWTIDFLPEELKPLIASLVQAGTATMKSALDA